MPISGDLLGRYPDHGHTWDPTLTEDGTPVTLTELMGPEVAHLIEDIDGYLCELGGRADPRRPAYPRAVPEGDTPLTSSITSSASRTSASLPPRDGRHRLRAGAMARCRRIREQTSPPTPLRSIAMERGERLLSLPPGEGGWGVRADALADDANTVIVTAGDALAAIEALCIRLLRAVHDAPVAEATINGALRSVIAVS